MTDSTTKALRERARIRSLREQISRLAADMERNGRMGSTGSPEQGFISFDRMGVIADLQGKLGVLERKHPDMIEDEA